MAGLRFFLTVQESLLIWIIVSQSDAYEPSNCYRMNNVFALGECLQGLKFLVRKPDRKPSSLHAACIYDGQPRTHNRERLQGPEFHRLGWP
jgi:hypothetical protein